MTLEDIALGVLLLVAGLVLSFPVGFLWLASTYVTTVLGIIRLHEVSDAADYLMREHWSEFSMRLRRRLNPYFYRIFDTLPFPLDALFGIVAWPWWFWCFPPVVRATLVRAAWANNGRMRSRKGPAYEMPPWPWRS